MRKPLQSMGQLVQGHHYQSKVGEEKSSAHCLGDFDVAESGDRFHDVCFRRVWNVVFGRLHG